MASPDKEDQSNVTPTKKGPSYTPGSTNPDKKKQQSRYGNMMDQETPGFTNGQNDDGDDF